MSSTLAKRASLPLLSARWTNLDAATGQGDRAEGARLAREGASGPEAMARFRNRLVAEGGSDLLRLYGDCARLLEDQGAKRDRLHHELDKEVVDQSDANQRQYDDRLGTLKRELGPDAPQYKERAARVEDAHKALRAVRGEVNSRPLRTTSGPLYLVAMAVLALAEVPVNRAAFELTFREEPVFSLLLAVAVGTVLIFFAHVVGLVLRRWPVRARLGQVLTRVAALLVILCGVGAGVYFMARMRQAFMRLTAAENDGFAQRLQDALRGGTTQAVQVAVDIPLSIGDLTFMAVNVLLFMFGVVASFLRHDPHPDYERAVREGRRADRAFAKVERRFNAAVRDETARYEERKRSLNGRMSELRSTIATLADQSTAVREHCAASRLQVGQTVLARCGVFAEGFRSTPGNTSASANAGSEPRPVAPTLPELLAELPAPEFRGVG